MEYTQDIVENIFRKNNLILNDKFINRKIKMDCSDFNGYKYCKNLTDIIDGYAPAKFHVSNPYTIDNIHHYIKLNNFEFKLMDNEYVGSMKNMNWACSCGELFIATWNEVRGGKVSCNFCSRSKRWDNFRDYTNEVLGLCNKNGYKLLDKYIHRGLDKFKYICSIHGVKESTYNDMKAGCGCMECGIISRGQKHRRPESELRELVEEKGFVYVGCDYDNSEAKNKKVNIHITCPKHKDKGIQKVKYDNLLNNTSGCIYCIGRLKTINDLQKELDDLHGLVTILEYNDYTSPILALCNVCDNKWETNGVNLSQGHRCPRCSASNFEREAAKLFDEWGVEYICQYIFNDCRNINPLPFDFYLPKHNALVELDGEGHYMPIRRGSMSDNEALNQLNRTMYHDTIKNKYCIDNNIKLIRIPYWDRKNLKDVLFYKIIGQTNQLPI